MLSNPGLVNMIDAVGNECQPANWWQRTARAALLSRARLLEGDAIELIDHDDRWDIGDQQASITPIRLVVRNPRFYTRVMRGGDLGFAESLMDGDWSCSDLPRLVRLLIRNMNTTDKFDGVLSRARKFFERLGHWLRRNTPKRSRTNIREHYDLGNDFFSLFLDPTMNYSSAVFDWNDQGDHPESLHRAQLRKMHQLCETLQLGPQDHLLEIGTGWGALACYAAKHFGCRVTTTTISNEQFNWARKRVLAEGLESQVEVLDQDYRTLTGCYDKIVSVEMIEAVGDEFYDTFFQQCQRLLKPEGMLLLQAITIVDQRYQKHLKNVDFICKYIFPGGSLPCISRLVGSAAQAAEMRLVQLHDYAPDYAETLRRWRRRFWQQADAIRDLGYDQRFMTMWDYYLAYCEAAFDERQINLVHALFAQRGNRSILSHQETHAQNPLSAQLQTPTPNLAKVSS
jgi:cyclopropane-fatty-acyl-phospholipid synthase